MPEPLMTLRRPEPVGRWAPLAKGFRPFFLLAAVHAVLMIPLWLLVLAGVLTPATGLDPTQWHAHEMIFGFACAVIVGFLLTAGSNWTSQVTAEGPWLGLLALLWLAGRLVQTVLPVPAIAAAIVDLAFLPAVAVFLGRAIVRTRSRRNYAFPVLLLVLFGANLCVHLDVLGHFEGGRIVGHAVALDVIVMVILVITGRIVPAFTRSGAGVEVRSIPWLERITVVSMAAVLLLDAFRPGFVATEWIVLLAGLAAFLRSVGWGARHTLRIPLLWVLHAGHLWLCLALLLRALSRLTDTLPPSVATHALTAGAIGTLTLGMMVRVTLGHTGRMLSAPGLLGFSFVLVTLAALVRTLGPACLPHHYLPALHLSGTLWTLAFAIYLIRLGPALLLSRADGKPG